MPEGKGKKPSGTQGNFRPKQLKIHTLWHTHLTLTLTEIATHRTLEVYTIPTPSLDRINIVYEIVGQRYLRQDFKMADGSSGTQQEEMFEDWLSCRMRQLGLDEDVFGSYVTGVLDSEDTDEDRKDALIDILEGMTVIISNNIVFTRVEICRL